MGLCLYICIPIRTIQLRILSKEQWVKSLNAQEKDDSPLRTDYPQKKKWPGTEANSRNWKLSLPEGDILNQYNALKKIPIERLTLLFLINVNFIW